MYTKMKEKQNVVNSMINYYENKMKHSHKQWELAVENEKPKAAAKHLQDYMNYKSMYESKMKECGQTV